MLDLGFSAINSMDLREISAPHLRQLSDETGTPSTSRSSTASTSSTSSAAARPGPGQREIDLNLHVGARLPAYCTAMGKAILAFIPEERLEEIIERIDFAPRGPNTLTDPKAFREELGRIRESGIAVNDEELAYGLRSIAAPIHSQSGEVVAALNLAVHRTMVSMDELIARYGPAVIADGTRHLAQHGAQAGAAPDGRAGRRPRRPWTPPPDVRETTEIGRYLAWLERERGLVVRGLRRAVALVGRRPRRRSGRRSGSSSR